MVITCNSESGLYSGGGDCVMSATSQDGSSRENYSPMAHGCAGEKQEYGTQLKLRDSNEYNLNHLIRTNWMLNLDPAAVLVLTPEA
ncbi:unnamed protein product [Trichobilharzia regenti]|nr:unnamed protein product [Trichobilharzia regenti]